MFESVTFMYGKLIDNCINNVCLIGNMWRFMSGLRNEKANLRRTLFFEMKVQREVSFIIDAPLN